MDEDRALIDAMRTQLQESARGERPLLDTLALARELADQFPHRSVGVIRSMIKAECGILSIPIADP
jgi:hypothetical protein